MIYPDHFLAFIAFTFPNFFPLKLYTFSHYRMVAASTIFSEQRVQNTLPHSKV